MQIAAPRYRSKTKEPLYRYEPARAQDALQKFTNVADKYPSTNPGKLARYYSALCFEDLERHNQAFEELKKISCGKGQELMSIAGEHQGIIYCRTRPPGHTALKFLSHARRTKA